MLAIMLAPMSGRELRTRISEEAQTDWQRASDQLQRTQAEMRQSLENIRQQLEAYDQQTRDQISTQLSQLQAKIEKQADVEQDS